jgi:N-acetylglucosamine-6-sulfatase
MATAMRTARLGRAFAAAASVAAAAVLFALATPTAAEARQTRPNVLVLMTDDQDIESMRVMPNVQRLLADRGTTFDQSFVSFALCCPSRATFFTGQYSHSHGVVWNALPDGGYAKLDKSNWLPLWLQRAGYRTIHLGKFLNGYGRQNSLPTEIPLGFDSWHGSVDPSTYQFYNYTVNEHGTLQTYGANRDPAFYQTDFYSRRAVELIEGAAPSDQPFFFSIGFLAPHNGGPREPGDPQGEPTPAPAPRHVNRFASEQLPSPPSFNEADVSDKPAFMRNKRLMGPPRIAAIRELYQQRLESLLSVDDAVGAIVGALEHTGELDNTLIIFTSDNGYFEGEHRVPQGKILVYEPSVRVPLIVSGPGVPRDSRRNQLVTNADLAPTILDATNVRPGRLQDGRSLFPLLRDSQREWGRDLLIEGGDGNRAGVTQFDALRTYRYVYVEYISGERELYDLRHDPYQLDSHHGAPAYASVQRLLARRLATLRGCGGPGCRSRPRVTLRVRRSSGRCRARIRGARIERVSFLKSGRRIARDRRRPFSRRVRVGRGRLRARVRTRDGRVVTVDRRLRRRCR